MLSSWQQVRGFRCLMEAAALSCSQQVLCGSCPGRAAVLSFWQQTRVFCSVTAACSGQDETRQASHQIPYARRGQLIGACGRCKAWLPPAASWHA